MEISEYFKTAKGRGVLATADSGGMVDAAVFAVPHIINEETVAFIMVGEKLTHKNLESNPHAAYLFSEEEEQYKGLRLFLTKIREEREIQKLDQIRRKKYPELEGKETLVFFKVDKVLPLIGPGAKP